MDRIKIRSFEKSLLVIILLLFFIPFLRAIDLKIRAFDHSDNNHYTRVVFESKSSFKYWVSTDNISLNHLVEILEVLDSRNLIIKNRSGKIDKIVCETLNGKSKFYIKSKINFAIWRQFVLTNPYRLVFDLKKTKFKKQIVKKTIVKEKPAVNNKHIVKEKHLVSEKHIVNEKHIFKKKNIDAKNRVVNTSVPTVSVKKKNVLDNKKINKSKIKIICIDPGHGGNNYGAVGSFLKEKDLTLIISKELKKLIIKKMNLKVIMVRESDYDVSLNKRAEIANNNNADVFISIHINSSLKKGARGPETFFVSLNATDKDAFELAKKENKSFEEIDKKVETEALKQILWDMAQTDYIRHSSVLADYIQQELNVLMHTRNRGVKQAPFRVLMRASMPAVLVEIGFISDRVEENMMKNSKFHKRAALAIFKGLEKYINR